MDGKCAAGERQYFVKFNLNANRLEFCTVQQFGSRIVTAPCPFGNHVADKVRRVIRESMVPTGANSK